MWLDRNVYILLLSLLHMMLAVHNMVNVTYFYNLFCRFCSGVVGKMFAVLFIGSTFLRCL